MNKDQTELPLINTKEDWRSKKFSFPKKTIRVATLFSGIGAIEHALERLKLKHKIIFACDNDPAVKKSYFANYNIGENNWHDDVCSLNAKKHKYKIDLLVGGSPCQSFSMVGKRGGLDDTRGTLFYEFARVIEESLPKVFIFENVKGLLSHDNGNTWQIIQNVFSDLGYHFQKPEILNSKHFGVPQNRNRIFVVGFRKKKWKNDFEYPGRIELNSVMQDYLEDYVDSKFYLKEKGIKFVASLKNQVKSYTQVNGNIALCQKANQQFNWHGDFIFEKASKRLNYDEQIFEIKNVDSKYYLSEKVENYVLSEGTKSFKTPPKTDLEIARPLLQSMHKMHRAGVDNYVTHMGKIRKLTPRECLRLMGFRDTFKIAVSDTQAYRQAGNSIVVDVLIALLKAIDISKYGVND
ncbi:DNA (cytosine-5-)-methyltransferase [Gammaproteobacteria bacterium]|nr:DNA (cytosine-5-)-methyltransferase [Gammaproteobacteria bacterium]